MPTTGSDRQLLAACAVAMAAGCALITVGLLLEPPLWLLRRLAG